MTTIAKVLIPNKSWLLENDGHKIGTLNRSRSSYYILKNGEEVPLGNVKDVKEKLGIIFDEQVLLKTENVVKEHSVYDFPANSKPYNAVYNIKRKLPIYSKSKKSKSQYCAGYYVIKFRKGWVKSFCPKLITLDRYPFHGPFKTDQEMRNMLININKKENETN